MKYSHAVANLREKRMDMKFNESNLKNYMDQIDKILVNTERII